MSQIALHHGAVRDFDSLPEYFQSLGVDKTVVGAPLVAMAKDQWRISVSRLRKLKNQLDRDGVQIAAVTIGWVRADALHEDQTEKQFRRIEANLELLGKVGVPLAQLFVMVPAEQEKADRRRQWDRLVKLCKRVAKSAKKAKVRVGFHGSQDAGHLITGLKGYRKLLDAVDHSHFGVTLCTGCLAIHGSDPAKCIRKLGDKLFFLHARDMLLHGDGQWTDVNLGVGHLDYRAIRRAIEKIGYDGPIQPEHLGAVSFETHEEITMARAVGFLKGLLEVEPARR